MDFAVQIIYPTTMQATLDQLVFGCDMIINNPFIADRGAIRLRNKNNNGQEQPT